VSIDVTMPKLSDTMEEGKILRWLKHVGDAVRIGDVIAEVETDKANMELEAFDDGVLAEVRVGENESAPVGAVIAVLGDGQAAAKPAKDAAPKAAPAPEPAAAPKPPPRAVAKVPAPPAEKSGREGEPEKRRPSVVRRAEPSNGGQVKASPLARRIAHEHGLDLRGVTGTGPGGRIVERDVEAALAGGEDEAPTQPGRPAPVELRAEGRAVGAAAAPPPAPGRLELSRIRRTTAKRMSEAKREVPHFYATAEIVMDEAVRMKDSLAALGEEYDGLTFTHLVLRAVGLALRRVPELNASYDGDALLLHGEVNVGLATATEQGLVVPVVRGCDRERLASIVRQARELIARARAGRFATDDLSGGTFTVSNLGMYPVSEFAAIINPPQAGILAVSTVREVPLVQAGAIVPGRVMAVTLSCDHRVVDGVMAGRFLKELKALLENPVSLVV
jgi:pyruvate dehydrogenase E2 component (dihydrolipoyllysine-residue acetyltransferase)